MVSAWFPLLQTFKTPTPLSLFEIPTCSSVHSASAAGGRRLLVVGHWFGCCCCHCRRHPRFSGANRTGILGRGSPRVGRKRPRPRPAKASQGGNTWDRVSGTQPLGFRDGSPVALGENEQTMQVFTLKGPGAAFRTVALGG